MSGRSGTSASIEASAPYRAVDLESEIRATGLEPHLLEIAAQSKGVMDIYDFLKIWPEMRSGYLLGWSEGNLIYQALSSSMGLLGWYDGYFKHRLHPKAMNHTESYMQAITETGEPIVFLVPRDLMNPERASITQREMKWLLERGPAALQNVYFVFGAYDFISPTELARLNRISGANAVREALRRIGAGQAP